MGSLDDLLDDYKQAAEYGNPTLMAYSAQQLGQYAVDFPSTVKIYRIAMEYKDAKLASFTRYLLMEEFSDRRDIGKIGRMATKYNDISLLFAIPVEADKFHTVYECFELWSHLYRASSNRNGRFSAALRSRFLACAEACSRLEDAYIDAVKQKDFQFADSIQRAMSVLKWHNRLLANIKGLIARGLDKLGWKFTPSIYLRED